MDLTWLYPWLVLAHVLSAFGFLAAHGVSIAVALRLNSERDLARIRALLDLSAASLGAMYAFVLGVLTSGIAAGIVGGWWTSGKVWIWLSLVLLIALGVYMGFRASPWLAEVRAAAGLPSRGLEQPGPEDPARLEAVLRSGVARELLVVGVIGVVVLVSLMELKPF